MTLKVDATRADLLKVGFVLPTAHPGGPVSVVGTFNDWTPGLDELLDNGDGTRSVVLGLPYGTRQVFRYLAPGPEWLDEPDADEITPEGSVLDAVARPSEVTPSVR